MDQENRELAGLLKDLSKRVDAMPDAEYRQTTESALSDIQQITSSLNDHVKSISETLTVLSKEV